MNIRDCQWGQEITTKNHQYKQQAKEQTKDPLLGSYLWPRWRKSHLDQVFAISYEFCSCPHFFLVKSISHASATKLDLRWLDTFILTLASVTTLNKPLPPFFLILRVSKEYSEGEQISLPYLERLSHLFDPRSPVSMTDEETIISVLAQYIPQFRKWFRQNQDYKFCRNAIKCCSYACTILAN